MKYLARSSSPSVSHHAVKRLFRKVYYARPSRKCKWWFDEFCDDELMERLKEIRKWEAEGTLLEHTVPLSEVFEKADLNDHPPPPRPVPINETDPFGKPTWWESIKEWLNPTQWSN